MQTQPLEFAFEIKRDYFDVACERMAKVQCERLPEHMQADRPQVDLFI
jgi:hypothetical protein|nr:MAG TPA: hypothetical protein [Caudoviricetes sp.]